MSNTYDLVALGGGHNGLTAAAYMAKAGKKVLVLERKPHIGVDVSTRELTLPGYWHDLALKGQAKLRAPEREGAVPMKARLKPEEARAALKLLSPQLSWFLVTILFRRSRETNPTGG